MLAAVEDREAYKPAADIVEHRGVASVKVVRQRTDQVLPFLLAPWLADVPAWRLGREQVRSHTELAALYDVPAHMARVALDGWPHDREALISRSPDRAVRPRGPQRCNC